MSDLVESIAEIRERIAGIDERLYAVEDYDEIDMGSEIVCEPNGGVRVAMELRVQGGTLEQSVSLARQYSVTDSIGIVRKIHGLWTFGAVR